jgi:hypothetical protein
VYPFGQGQLKRRKAITRGIRRGRRRTKKKNRPRRKRKPFNQRKNETTLITGKIKIRRRSKNRRNIGSGGLKRL